MKNAKRILSLFLILALLLQVLPLSAFAATGEESQTAEQTEADPSLLEADQHAWQEANTALAAPEYPELAPDEIAEAAEEKAYVLYEEAALRTQDEKHFRMSDGGFMAVSYGGDVHYQDKNGAWQDIDNTLTRKKADLPAGMQAGAASDVYQTVNGDQVRQFAAALDESGYLFTARSGKTSVSFAINTGAAQATPALAAASDEAEFDVTTAPIAAKITSAMEQQKPLTDAERKAQPLAQQVEPKKLTSELTYSEVWPATDLVYQPSGMNVKESIVVAKPQDAYRYTFRLSLEGLSAEAQEDGSILLVDAEGTAVFEIPAPYLEDASGAASDAAAYTLEQQAGEILLTVTADETWMNTPDRVWPITIDPTVLYITNSTNKDIITTFVNDGAKVPDLTTRKEYLRSGYYTNTGDNGDPNCTGHTVGLLYFNQLPPVPQGCVVTNAILELTQYSYGGTNNYGYHRLYATTASLSSPESDLNSMTWSNYVNNIYSHYALDSGSQPSALDFAKETNSYGRKTDYDITPAAQKWYGNDTSITRLLALDDGHNTSQNARITYAGYCQTNVNYRPRLYVTYRNLSGIESIYGYHEQSIGRAGTGYVNDFTTNLTMVVPVITAPSETLPFELSLVYNGNLANADFTNNNTSILTGNYSTAHAGYGWKSSVQQTVVKKEYSIDGTNNQKLTYYVYTDGDGTMHYFAPDNGSTTVYKDEDGLGLTITVQSGTKYEMEDKAGNTWVFTNGYLTTYTSSDSNQLFYAYDGEDYRATQENWKPSNATSAHRVTTVWRKNNGASTLPQKVATLNYDEGSSYTNYLTSVVDAADRRTTFSYSGGNLRWITFPDGIRAEYLYGTNAGYHRLIEAIDHKAGYRVTYSYQYYYPLGVGNFTEYTLTSTNAYIAGQSVNCYRSSAAYTRYRYFDIDDTTGSGKYVTRHYFDRWGRTVNVLTMNPEETEVLGVSEGTYTSNADTDPKNNHLISTASVGIQGNNIILDPCFEQGDLTTDPNWYYNNVSGSGAITGADATMGVSPRNGTKMMVLSSTDDVKTANQRVYLEGGKTYVFSAYVNTQSITGSDSGGAYIAFQDQYGSYNYATSQSVNYQTNSAIENGWQRIEAVYTPGSSGRVMVKLFADHVGPVAFDDVQLEQIKSTGGLAGTGSAGAFNLIQSADFEYPNTTTGAALYYPVLRDWALSNQTSISNADAHTGSYSIKASAGVTAKRRVIQTVELNRPGTNTYILSGWGRTPATHIGQGEDMIGDNNGNKRFFGIIAEIRYADNAQTDYRYVTFNDNISEWQYASTVIVPKRDHVVSKIIVYLALDYCTNDVYFDDIALIQEPVQTYDYDENGNPISATNGENKTSAERDEYNRLTSYKAINNVAFTLAYDDGCYHPKTITSDGLKTTYTYSAGLPTQAKRQSEAGTGAYLQSTAAYSDSKNFQTSSNSENNISRTYEYSEEKGLLTTTKNPHKQNPNDNNRALTTSNGYVATTDQPKYSYQIGLFYNEFRYIDSATEPSTQNKNLLSQLQLKSFRGTSPLWKAYSFTYDAWGQTTAIMVNKATGDSNPSFSDGKTLVSYGYDSKNRLATTTYPDAWAAHYTYDMFDRLIHTWYTDAAGNNEKQYYYAYNSNGQLANQFATAADSTAKTENYTFAYDSLGRLIRSREERDGAFVQRIEHQYDMANRLVAQNWTIGSDSFSESYTYRGDLTGDGRDGLVDTFTAANGKKMVFGYDSLKRSTGYTVKDGANTVYSVSQSFRTVSGSRTSNQVSQYEWKNSAGTTVSGWQYQYDTNGRLTGISEITYPYRLLVSYTYDLQDQLTREEYYDYGSGSSMLAEVRAIDYTYDTAGNILSISDWENNEVSYAYTDTNWPDLLTGITVNGTFKAISYNSGSGNPTTWYNGTDYSGFRWEQGNRLTRVYANGGYKYYRYDMSGVRTEKTVGGVTHSYVTQNGKVVRESYGSKVLDFIYDAAGRPFALRYSSNGGSSFTTYYYRLNLQGDVIALVNTDGSTEAIYEYDAWGYPLYTSATTMSSINPLRYRGYYYDTETGWYYLQSRYYDPAVRRFINADSYAGTGQGFLGYNMFAYCENSPTFFKDDAGHWMNTCQMVMDGAGAPAPTHVSQSSQEFYDSNKDRIQQDIVESISSPPLSITVIQTSSMEVTTQSRIKDYITSRICDAAMGGLVALTFGPIGAFSEVYSKTIGVLELVDGTIDLAYGVNNENGTYEEYTVFVSTSSELYGRPAIKTTILHYCWFKHTNSPDWTFERGSVNTYYSYMED